MAQGGSNLDTFDLYKDISARTNGEIYIGIVGPVRTGKSTFIKRFMDLMVIPSIADENDRIRAKDELPQSAAGKTIMTTEPKFIPKEAVEISLGDISGLKIRMIDCVGYMVEGASGHIENDVERMVKTPWFDYEIPFTKAAEIGTKKVINDHSTIGIVVTSDGSFGDINRENYVEPETTTINELKKLKKPFIVLLNSAHPHSEETIQLANDIENNNNVKVMPVNCEQLKKEDIYSILENVLYEFPVSELDFYIPKWIEMLPIDHWLKSSIIEVVKLLMDGIKYIRNVSEKDWQTDNEYIKSMGIESKDLSNGKVAIKIDLNDDLYYKILSELTGTQIDSEYELINNIHEMSLLKDSYSKVKDAMESVQNKGYGVVTPNRDEIILGEPEVIKTGNKYGVKIKAEAPSIHMIKAGVMVEIAPIVGTEDQAKDLIEFIKKNSEESPEGIWGTNIFGKSIEQIVNDGISGKITKLSEETQQKMQETLQKITNDSKGGVICIII